MVFSRLHRAGEALIVALCLCQLNQLANASPANYAQAVSDYQNKRYLQALNEFQAADRESPNDPTVHYYLGLCYQASNQLAKAATQFQWVIIYGSDPNLKSGARLGLEQIDRLRASVNVQNTHLTKSSSVQIASANSTAKKDTPKFVRGRMKVIEFKTKWCHVCKTFDPVFDETTHNSKYSSNCDFKRLDAEEEANFELVQKYSITRFPTIICADSAGRQIFRFAGGTDAAGLERMLDQSLAQIPD
jgi:thioredoxin-like negative regulator of GroEL